MRILRLRNILLTATVGLMPCTFANALEALRPTCDTLINPLSLETATPRFSWMVEPARRGAAQTGYQVIVASSPELIDANEGNLWNSGRVDSDQSVFVPYGGAALDSGQRAYWKVRIWDEHGEAGPWSDTQSWSMALDANDWRATWIGTDTQDEERARLTDSLTDASWVWVDGVDPISAPPMSCALRRVFELPRDANVTSATLLIRCDDDATIRINGQQIAEGVSHHEISELDVTGSLRGGDNAIAIHATNFGDSNNPAALLAQLRITLDNGETIAIETDADWRGTTEPTGRWDRANFNDKRWQPVQIVAPSGAGPWGSNLNPSQESGPLAARYLRRDFDVPREVERATVYLSPLGYGELYIDGNKIGDALLDPGIIDFDKRVFYVTHDVTEHLTQGPHAMGVILGNGRYHAPRIHIPTFTRTFGHPRLLLQLHITYTDGTTEIITSDTDWKITANGPIRANNAYDGEIYDANLEMPGWSEPGFDDTAWEQAVEVEAPRGELVSQVKQPMRVTEEIRPVSVTRIGDNWVFDLGQNFAGQTRLAFNGEAGQVVTVRHAEILGEDGDVFMGNLRSAKAQNIYTCATDGPVTYQPRFHISGFRYVSVSGLRETPTPDTVTGLVVHNDLRRTGTWSSSNPLLNQLWSNAVWGLRSLYASIPQGCSQRDERQGWTGDRIAIDLSATYLFDTVAFNHKWLEDIRLSQFPDGHLPPVAPPLWPFGDTDIIWPSVYVTHSLMLYEQFGDSRALHKHYPSMQRYIDFHWNRRGEDGLCRDITWSDWCPPPEAPNVIMTSDPTRVTDHTLAGSSFLAFLCGQMAKAAEVLGESSDAAMYRKRYETMRQSINEHKLDTSDWSYANKTQSTFILPLFFGLTPDGHTQDVFNRFVKRVVEQDNTHVAVGLVGSSYLMRVLTDNGRPDIAYQLATNTTYPSWGYMVENGATTYWELWNGDTADLEMNSYNHLMLVGDLVTWMHEDLAGIEADFDEPGFKHVIMRPVIVGDLTHVSATHESPYGHIASAWQIEDGEFAWDVTVPANAHATLYLPAGDSENVIESGRAVDSAEGVTVIGIEDDRLVVRVTSGTYQFTLPINR